MSWTPRWQLPQVPPRSPPSRAFVTRPRTGAQRRLASVMRSRIWNVAHRGASAERPENTLAAFELAIAQKADVIEADVRATADGHLLILHDADFEDLVTAVHLISSELKAKGFGEQLLAAAFRFDGGEHPVYLIYGYKRGAFWPFVPTGKDQERYNAEELELKAKLDGELPIEQDISRWFAMFDAPL